MKFVEVLCEGSSDVPAIQEVLTRRFHLVKDTHFRIHPHRGKGKLPSPENRFRETTFASGALLDQLPVKLKNMGKQSRGDLEVVVVVIVDADKDDCKSLKSELVELYESLPSKPKHVLFRVAVEETESWFIADIKAVRKAYKNVKVSKLDKIIPDQVCGAWERLAEALGRDPKGCSGRDKYEWAERIVPHLQLRPALSPSLDSLISGLDRLLNHAME